MNQHTRYLLQVMLCLITLAGIFVALTQKRMDKRIRILVAMCPLIYGAVFYLMLEDSSGLFAMLMGLVALVFVLLHLADEKGEELEEQEEQEEKEEAES